LTILQKKPVRNGSGPRCLEGDGVTAKVRDIISRTEAIEPLVRRFPLVVMMLRLSSSVSVWLSGFEALRNTLRDSWILSGNAWRLGSLVLCMVYTSTVVATMIAMPASTPPSIQSCRLSKIKPSSRGCSARSVPNRFSNQIWRSPPVCERVRA
jgi:hypothetical protein